MQLVPLLGAETWNSMGAMGVAAVVDARVALFRMCASRPPIATTLPAETLLSCSRPLPIIMYSPFTCRREAVN